MKRYLEKQKCFEFLIWNKINLLFSYLCIKSKLDKLRGHKVAPVNLHKFDLLLHSVPVPGSCIISSSRSNIERIIKISGHDTRIKCIEGAYDLENFRMGGWYLRSALHFLEFYRFKTFIGSLMWGQNELTWEGDWEFMNRNHKSSKEPYS